MARYELVDRIGVGGMAEIFRGKAIAGGGFEKPVAIKRILPHLSQDKRFVELLITEAKTLSQLRHRNIVQIYDVGIGDDGQYFLVMEFVDGLDLGHLYEDLEKRQRRLPLDVALHVMGEVCEALDHAHRARGSKGEPLGLVHRDVSPSNVLLSRSGEVKLTDFGIAKRTEEVTGHGGVRGKFAYISPEQAHNKHVDARSDVYSVGIVLFELVTGNRLFSSMPDFDALRTVREGRIPRPRDVDPGLDEELERILLTALAPRLEDRFPSAGNFGAQLRQYRYSLDATAADPAVEIGRMIEEHGVREGGGAIAREPTFVRINTVAGFTGGFELSEESTGGGSEEMAAEGSGRIDLEDEETRAVRIAEAMRRSTSEPTIDELETRVQTDPGSPAGRSSPSPGPTGEFDLSDAETSVHDFRRPRGLLDRPLPAALFGRRNGTGSTKRGASSAAGLATSPDGLAPPIGELPRGAMPPQDGSGTHAREPAPTIRQIFFGGRFDPRAQRPGTAGPPILGEQPRAGRRRTLIIVGGGAAALVIVGLLLVAMLGDGGTSSSAAPIEDAGVAVDASLPTMTMPPEKVDPPAERPRRKKKRPTKKKTTVKKRSGDRR